MTMTGLILMVLAIGAMDLANRLDNKIDRYLHK
jgi:hypothetical protein